jgi:hypothetical protein
MWSFQTSKWYQMEQFYARTNDTKMGNGTTMLLWLPWPPKDRKMLAGCTNHENTKPVLGYMGPQEQNIALGLASVERQIEEEYEWGYQNLLTKDYKWLKPSLQTTKKLLFENKLQWIESVRLARIRYQMCEQHSHSISIFLVKTPLTIAKWMANAPIDNPGSDEGSVLWERNFIVFNMDWERK